jgi:hypothetical protein
MTFSAFVYTHTDQIYKKVSLKDGQSILFCIQIIVKSGIYLSQLPKDISQREW